MRRHTGAAGIAVAIAALVPLTDTAHAEGLEARSPVHQEAARPGLDADPGGSEPLSPDALPQDSADEGLPDAGGADQGRYEEDPLGQEGAGQDGFGQGGIEQGGPGQDGFGQDGFGQDEFGQDGFGPGQAGEGVLGDGRPDGGGIDGSGIGLVRPDQGRPGQVGLGQGREAHEGAVAGASLHWASDPTISATSKPRPTPTAPAPAATTPAPATSAPTASPTAVPTLGTQGGLGGASSSGPSGQDIAIGLGCVASAALAAGYALLRRRRNA
ncbi:hypothetical protein ACFUIW_29715 [Streptomyces sp. NPDC057245]|uniref:hypothetical protein n=1 Tax=Streptomyces sp. NPDC057245 TaxID=3346065 RepID=UPI00363B9386